MPSRAAFTKPHPVTGEPMRVVSADDARVGDAPYVWETATGERLALTARDSDAFALWSWRRRSWPARLYALRTHLTAWTARSAGERWEPRQIVHSRRQALRSLRASVRG